MSPALLRFRSFYDTMKGLLLREKPMAHKHHPEFNYNRDARNTRLDRHNRLEELREQEIIEDNIREVREKFGTALEKQHGSRLSNVRRIIENLAQIPLSEWSPVPKKLLLNELRIEMEHLPDEVAGVVIRTMLQGVDKETIEAIAARLTAGPKKTPEEKLLGAA